MSSNDDLFDKIDQVLVKSPENRHSYYQLKYFVLGKEPTTQSQLWQCLRELQARKETISTLQLQIEDTKDEVELLRIDHEKFHVDETVFQNAKLNDLAKRERAIKVKRLKRKEESLLSNINKLEWKLKFEIEEARFFLQAFEGLEKIEKVKDYDDYDAQKELWEAKIGEEINLRILTRQPLPPDLLKTGLSLHKDSPVREQLVAFLESRKTQIQIECEKENYVGKIDNK